MLSVTYVTEAGCALMDTRKEHAQSFLISSSQTENIDELIERAEAAYEEQQKAIMQQEEEQRRKRLEGIAMQRTRSTADISE